MKISKITFTGADDKTNTDILRSISYAHPQVEWGILLSRNNGHARYPKWAWIEELLRGEQKLPLAAHMCGKYVRNLFAGDFEFMDKELIKGFRRIQVNFHGIQVMEAEAELFLNKLIPYARSFEWLFQMDGVNDYLYWLANVQNIRVFPFFDISGGDGILPDKWPAPLGKFCGYAGGLGPQNLEAQLKKLDAVVGSNNPIWIDMESHVRNDVDEFDFERIKRCIEIAEPYFI